MKATGMVRRIDELGRIVIPKEIRKSINIHNGEELDISINEDEIVLKKLQKINNYSSKLSYMLDIIKREYGYQVFITDLEKIIAASNKDIINSRIDSHFDYYLQNREKFNFEQKKIFNFEGKEITGYFGIIPIIVDSDILGLVVQYDEMTLSSNQNKFLNVFTLLLISMLDIS